MSVRSAVRQQQKKSFALILRKVGKEFLENQQAKRAEQERRRKEEQQEEDMPPPPIDWGVGEVDHLLKILDEQDDTLERAGFHRMSSWWRREIERFLRSGRRRWVIRVGRRGGKSTSLCRLFIAWARSGLWRIPPGEVAIIPIVSKDMSEAADRVTNLEEILKKLGYVEKEDYKSTGYTIEMLKERLEFRVYANKVIVGPTAIAFFGDEVAHWESGETAKNHAKKIMSAVRPTMASQPLSFEVLSSAPWGSTDYHYALFEKGEEDPEEPQICSYAPTWVANDNFISEARTRQIEPDVKEWEIAYKAIPGATVTSAFDRNLVLACFRQNFKGRRNEQGYVSLDPSELREDAFAAIAGYTTDKGELLVEHIEGWEADAIGPDTDYDTICSSVTALATRFQTGEVYGDQCEQTSIKGLLGRRNKHYIPIPWTRQSKHDAITLLRRLMRTGRLLIFVEHDKLKKELLECKAEKTPSGDTRYETNGLDYLSALISAAHAVNEGHLLLNDAAGLSDEDMEMWASGHELGRVGGL